MICCSKNRTTISSFNGTFSGCNDSWTGTCKEASKAASTVIIIMTIHLPKRSEGRRLTNFVIIIINSALLRHLECHLFWNIIIIDIFILLIIIIVVIILFLIIIVVIILFLIIIFVRCPLPILNASSLGTARQQHPPLGAPSHIFDNFPILYIIASQEHCQSLAMSLHYWGAHNCHLHHDHNHGDDDDDV